MHWVGWNLLLHREIQYSPQSVQSPGGCFLFFWRFLKNSCRRVYNCWSTIAFGSIHSLLLGMKQESNLQFSTSQLRYRLFLRHFLCLLLVNLLLLANLEERSTHEKLDFFLEVENNMLKDNDLVDEATENVFALFWEAIALLVEKALSCF